MITGDNPLTACHVAMQVHIANEELLILNYSESNELYCSDISGTVSIPFTTDNIRSVMDGYQLCITGQVSCI